jgi:hypothetical protein
MSRLKSSDYAAYNTTSSNWSDNEDDYNTSYSYDLNGNISTLGRRGLTDPLTDPATFGLLDSLTYTYSNSGSSNQLAKVNESGNDTEILGVEQFLDGTNTGDDYSYDDNGNLTEDKNKDITSITYNHLNKPTQILFGNQNSIGYIYDATGTKLQQKVSQVQIINQMEVVVTTTTDYIGGFHYEACPGRNYASVLCT